MSGFFEILEMIWIRFIYGEFMVDFYWLEMIFRSPSSLMDLSWIARLIQWLALITLTNKETNWLKTIWVACKTVKYLLTLEWWTVRTAMRSMTWMFVITINFIFVTIVGARRSRPISKWEIDANKSRINAQIGRWFNGSACTFQRFKINETVATRSSSLQQNWTISN